MAANTPSFNKIIQIIQEVSQAHFMVKNFRVGPQWDMDNTWQQIQTPYVWMDIPKQRTVIGTGNTMVALMDMTLVCMDRISNDQENYLEVLSDTKYILETIISEISQHPLYVALNLSIDSGSSIMYEPQEEATDTFSNGYMATFALRFPIRYTPCNNPIGSLAGYTYSLNNNVYQYSVVGVPGATGPQGPIGPTGNDGIGIQGNKGGLQYDFSGLVVTTPVGTGSFGFDQVGISAVNNIYISSHDLYGNDFTAYFLQLSSGFSMDNPIVGQIYIADNNDLLPNYVVFNITGTASTVGINTMQIPVSYLSGTDLVIGNTQAMMLVHSGINGTDGEGNDGSNTLRWTAGPSAALSGIYTSNAAEFNSASLFQINTIDSNSVNEVNWHVSLQSWVNIGNSAILQVTEVGNNSIFGIYRVNSISFEPSNNQWDYNVSVISGNGGINYGSLYSISWVLNGTGGGGGSQNLQQVLNIGNTASSPISMITLDTIDGLITVQGTGSNISQLGVYNSGSFLQVRSKTSNNFIVVKADDDITQTAILMGNNGAQLTITSATLSVSRNQSFQDADGIIALLSDISGGGTGSQGPVGPQGFMGPTGFQGFQGIQGPIGITGPQGFQGTQGIKGNTGSQGFQGPTGSQGFQGIQGSIGSQGNQGPTGPQGFQGTQGFQGSVGIMGNTGSTGPQGFQGFQGPSGGGTSSGPQGPTGPQGFQGFQGPSGGGTSSGATGPQGFQGSVGIMGNTGSTGPQGFQGIQGSIGLQGPTGPQGFQGIQGVTGPQGFQGSIGLQGPTGSQGFQGNQGSIGMGNTGSQGPTGPQGFQGIQGATGHIGSTGPQGFQGFQGATGVQGVSGLTGATGPQGFQGPGGGGGASSLNYYRIPFTFDFAPASAGQTATVFDPGGTASPINSPFIITGVHYAYINIVQISLIGSGGFSLGQGTILNTIVPTATLNVGGSFGTGSVFNAGANAQQWINPGNPVIMQVQAPPTSFSSFVVNIYIEGYYI